MMKNIPVTVLMFVLLSSGAVRAEMAVYESHFEDEIHNLTGWKTQNGLEGAVVEIRNEAGKAVLRVQVPARDEPLRIAQTGNLFRLAPGTAYELRAKIRVTELELPQGGLVRIMVTDARWDWSSPPIRVTVANPEWEDVAAAFTTPDEFSESDKCRVRIDVKNAQMDLEIAEISVVQAN